MPKIRISILLILGSPGLFGAAPRTGTAAPRAEPPLASCPLAFSDVPPDFPFYPAIECLACAEVISGYRNGTFRPYQDTTRGQLAKIVVGATGWVSDTSGGPHFGDVPPTHPFYASVETAYHHGVISGYRDGTFRPAAPITRGQLAKILVAANGATGDLPGAPHFRDVPSAHPFYTAVETAYATNLITGYGCGTGCREFRVSANATRAQIAKIVAVAFFPACLSGATPTPPLPTRTGLPSPTLSPSATAFPPGTASPTLPATATATPTPLPTGMPTDSPTTLPTATLPATTSRTPSVTSSIPSATATFPPPATPSETTTATASPSATRSATPKWVSG